MEFLKNIAVNLQATGPAAVVIAWMICITLLGLFGSGTTASMAIIILCITGSALITSLGQRSGNASCKVSKGNTEDH